MTVKKKKTKKTKQLESNSPPPSYGGYTPSPKSQVKDLKQLLKFYGYATDDDKTFDKTFPGKYRRKITINSDTNVTLDFTTSAGVRTVTNYHISDIFNWIY